MKIGILSRSQKIYSTRRLKEAALARGHDVKVLNTLRFAIFSGRKQPRLLFRGKPLSRYDAVIPRIGASITFYGTAVVRHFEQMGVFSLASSHAISVSRDKLRSTQVLSRHDIGIPPTVFVRDKNQVLAAVQQVGGAPVIIKVLEGTQGVGVILAETAKTAQAIIETLQMAKQNVLIQSFVKESRGCDVRAFVVGDKVVAAMRRVAQGDEFRSNVHRGGRVEKFELPPEYERTALLAAQVMGLRVAGVDMLEGKDGPQLMEVNSSPGLEGIERASGVDVAGAIISHLEEQVEFPDLDIRQRLTLKSGYGVAEIPIDRVSDLAGKTVRATGLRDRDIMVMNIQRGSVVIPNPKGDREILAGDTLLCFGKLMTLKGMIPAKKRKQMQKARNETARNETVQGEKA